VICKFFYRIIFLIQQYVQVTCMKLVYISSSFVSFRSFIRSCSVHFSYRSCEAFIRFSFVSFAFFVRLHLLLIVNLYDPGSVVLAGNKPDIYQFHTGYLYIKCKRTKNANETNEKRMNASHERYEKCTLHERMNERNETNELYGKRIQLHIKYKIS
jgi:hypothetical protein